MSRRDRPFQWSRDWIVPVVWAIALGWAIYGTLTIYGAISHAIETMPPPKRCPVGEVKILIYDEPNASFGCVLGVPLVERKQ